jgi:transposase InsO family protein
VSRGNDAKTTAELFVDLGVAASFSRPRVSNNNPFSEAQFKTLKYRPEFPKRFDGLEHARAPARLLRLVQRPSQPRTDEDRE